MVTEIPAALPVSLPVGYFWILFDYLLKYGSSVKKFGYYLKSSNDSKMGCLSIPPNITTRSLPGNLISSILNAQY